MSLKFVCVPDVIVIATMSDEPLTWSLAQGVAFIVDNSPDFNKPQSRVRMGARLCDAFEKEGAVVELRAEDWQVLQEVIESGETPWGSWLTTPLGADGKPNGSPVKVQISPRRFLSFTNAISEAKNAPPSDSE